MDSICPVCGVDTQLDDYYHADACGLISKTARHDMIRNLIQRCAARLSVTCSRDLHSVFDPLEVLYELTHGIAVSSAASSHECFNPWETRFISNRDRKLASGPAAAADMRQIDRDIQQDADMI